MSLPKMMILSLFLLNTVSSAQAQIRGSVETCPTVTLDQNGGTAANIPVWNQHSLPACYVFSASLLASVWVREFWSSGRSDLKTYIDDPTISFGEIQKSPLFDQILDADLGRTCQATQYILSQKRTRLMDPSNPNFIQPVCDMYGFKKDKAGNNVLRTPEEFNDRMHELLETGSRPLPFAIEYCSGTFSRTGKELITSRTFHASLNYLNDEKRPENFDKNCGFHAAIITGQAIRNGVCQYRVRNSTGDASRKNIDGGYYWIPSQDLSKNTLRVITLNHE